MIVDPAVSGKRITVVSVVPGKPLTNAQLAGAAASLYGLRALALTDGSVRLARRRISPVSGIAGLRESILDALPAPVMRALLQPGQPGQPGQPVEGKSELSPAPIATLTPAVAPPIARRMESIREAAVRSLRRETGVRLPHTALKPLPLSECSEGARQAFAVAYILNSLKDMEKIVALPVPRKVSQINDLYISGGAYEKDGMGLFTMVFSVMHEGGKRLMGDSIVLMRHPLPPSLHSHLLRQGKTGSGTKP